MVIRKAKQSFSDIWLHWRISRAVLRHPDIARLDLGPVIKNVKTRQVVACRINGERMIVKRFSSGNPRGTVHSLATELNQVSGHMSTGRNQVNICRFAFPEEGLVVLSLAEGQRFDDCVSQASPKIRQDQMRRAGEWLAVYATGRRKPVSWHPQKLIDVCSRSVSPSLSLEDTELLANLRRAMAKHSAETKGLFVTKAASHGDYTGLNLHVSGDLLTGVDIQKTTRTMLARDIARFLVWSHLNYPEASDWYGLSKSDKQAFLSSGIIPDVEAKHVLPFFVADQFHRRFQRMHTDKTLGPRVRRACKSWIAFASSQF